MSLIDSWRLPHSPWHHGQQLLSCRPKTSPSWYWYPCVITSSQLWMWPRDSLIASRTGQKWWDVTSEKRLHGNSGFHPEPSLRAHVSTCQAVSCPREAVWPGTGAELWLATKEDMMASVHQSRDGVLTTTLFGNLEANPSSGWDCGLDQGIDVSPVSVLGAAMLVNLCSDFWPTELKKTDDCCWKPLNFGVLCYAGTGNLSVIYYRL